MKLSCPMRGAKRPKRRGSAKTSRWVALQQSHSGFSPHIQEGLRAFIEVRARLFSGTNPLTRVTETKAYLG